MTQDSLFVEPTKTFITETDIIHAVKQAYHSLFKTDGSLETISILSAQIFFECGRGKECYNNNLGNIKKTKNHQWTWFSCSEYIKGVNTHFHPPHPQTHFNAYISLPCAAQEHLKFLNGERYHKALEEAQKGNVINYCTELKSAGYFTDTIEHYTKVMVSIFNEIKDKYYYEIEEDPYEQK